MAALDITGQIVGAGTATAGLILVFLGATTASYEGYQAQERRSVRDVYQLRANIAFATLLVSIATVVFALLSDWFDASGLAVASFGLLCVSLVGVAWTAYISVSEIK